MKEINLDGYELPEGRILGSATWVEDKQEWRALMNYYGTLALVVLNITDPDITNPNSIYYERVV